MSLPRALTLEMVSQVTLTAAELAVTLNEASVFMKQWFHTPEASSIGYSTTTESMAESFACGFFAGSLFVIGNDTLPDVQLIGAQFKDDGKRIPWRAGFLASFTYASRTGKAQ